MGKLVESMFLSLFSFKITPSPRNKHAFLIYILHTANGSNNSNSKSNMIWILNHHRQNHLVTCWQCQTSLRATNTRVIPTPIFQCISNIFIFYSSEKENGKKKPDRARDPKKTENQNDSSDEEDSNQAGEFSKKNKKTSPSFSSV